MDPATRDRLKDRFDGAAVSYSSSRPGYPAAAVAWLVGGPATRTEAVLDLGAGSGSLSRLLTAPDRFVVAADPSLQLLAELRREALGALAVRTGAESLPFARASYDVVTVATAFHWFDHGRALPEIHRVLRPGGRLSLTWNTRAVADDWTGELDRLLREAQPSDLQGDWGLDSAGVLDNSSWFEPPSYAEFPHVQRLGRAALVDLVSSRSYVIALAADERARLLAAVRTLFDSGADDGTVDLPYICQCWRAVRRDTS